VLTGVGTVRGSEWVNHQQTQPVRYRGRYLTRSHSAETKALPETEHPAHAV